MPAIFQVYLSCGESMDIEHAELMQVASVHVTDDVEGLREGCAVKTFILKDHHKRDPAITEALRTLNLQFVTAMATIIEGADVARAMREDSMARLGIIEGGN